MSMIFCIIKYRSQTDYGKFYTYKLNRVTQSTVTREKRISDGGFVIKKQLQAQNNFQLKYYDFFLNQFLRIIY
ncbi:hypothetical protein pb186bvf_012185 [Paramecium bursaria]